MKSVLGGFKEFVIRGNAVDLAVGVVIGAAFTGVVTALVKSLINPIIAALFGKPDISDLWNITLRHDAKGAPINISVGAIADAALQLLLVAAAVYFVIVLPMNGLRARRAKAEEPKAPDEDVALLRDIRDLLAAQADKAITSGTPRVARHDAAQ